MPFSLPCLLVSRWSRVARSGRDPESFQDLTRRVNLPDSDLDSRARISGDEWTELLTAATSWRARDVAQFTNGRPQSLSTVAENAGFECSRSNDRGLRAPDDREQQDNSSNPEQRFHGSLRAGLILSR
jgi:hypothetical protein